jgi:hypothetical protein
MLERLIEKSLFARRWLLTLLDKIAFAEHRE